MWKEVWATPAEDEEMEIMASQVQQLMPRVEDRTLG